MTNQPDMQCPECRGRGYAEIIGGWERPCDACKGTGEQLLHLSDFISAMTEPDLPPELLELVAKIIAPHLEGGREFDQMPRDRIALRKWSREGICNTNDATQDDALEVACAVAPDLIAHGRELAEVEVVQAIKDQFDPIRTIKNHARLEILNTIQRREHRSKGLDEKEIADEAADEANYFQRMAEKDWQS